jgi:hypothetical protein
MMISFGLNGLGGPEGSDEPKAKWRTVKTLHLCCQASVQAASLRQLSAVRDEPGFGRRVAASATSGSMRASGACDAIAGPARVGNIGAAVGILRPGLGSPVGLLLACRFLRAGAGDLPRPMPGHAGIGQPFRGDAGRRCDSRLPRRLRSRAEGRRRGRRHARARGRFRTDSRFDGRPLAHRPGLGHADWLWSCSHGAGRRLRRQEMRARGPSSTSSKPTGNASRCARNFGSKRRPRHARPSVR